MQRDQRLRGRALEEAMIQDFSPEIAQSHAAHIAGLGERHSGQPAEAELVEYLARTLEEYGLDVNIFEFEAFLSYGVKDAIIEVLAPERRRLDCVVYAFSGSTPPKGVEGDLVFVQRGFPKDYQGKQVDGRFVMTEMASLFDLSTNEKALYAEEFGAAGLIISGGIERPLLVMGTVGSHYGNPTPEKLADQIRIPTMYVRPQDGEWLRHHAANGPVRLRIAVEVPRGWHRVRLPVGELRGRNEPEKFVLIASHMDGWWDGATDPGGANAFNLELARVFAKYRDQLKRSVRIAFWPGHSTGLYSGSTWYVDNLWDDLRENAIAYFFNDQMGSKGADYYTVWEAAPEVAKFHDQCIRETIGDGPIEKRRMMKTGDTSSFWGVGVPSLTDRLTFAPDRRKGQITNFGWWWHTTEDTVDKVDMVGTRKPFESQVRAVTRLCNDAILPLDYTGYGEELERALEWLNNEAALWIELEPLLVDARAISVKGADLARRLKALREAKGLELDTELKTQTKELNQRMLRLSRTLLPVDFTIVGPYDQDYYSTWYLNEPLPALTAPVKKMKELEPGSAEVSALRTKLVRERNRVRDELRKAVHLLEETLEIAQGMG